MCTASASNTPEITAPPRISRRGKKVVSAMADFEDEDGPNRKRLRGLSQRRFQDQNMTAELLEQAGVRYAYKASLLSSAYQFELTADGLSWRVAGRTAV